MLMVIDVELLAVAIIVAGVEARGGRGPGVEALGLVGRLGGDRGVDAGLLITAVESSQVQAPPLPASASPAGPRRGAACRPPSGASTWSAVAEHGAGHLRPGAIVAGVEAVGLVD